MMINDVLLEQIIEGALLASGQTLSVDRIHALFDEGFEPEKDRILNTLERISDKCASKGYELKKVATGYRFQVKQDLGKWISRLWEEKPQRYSRALLETLSIIAYRQPVTRGEIEDVRGVAVSSHITKTLVEREWIQVVGHRDVPGRPAMFATTKMFLDYFNLESLDQLPTLEEIQEIADANHSLELEDKTQEGDFDFSSHTQELEDSENLISAAKDMEEADALVQKVEDALFNKPDEGEQESSDQGELIDAEQQVAQADDILDAVISEDEALIAEDATEEEIAEATIARMIAEQERLINESEQLKAPNEKKDIDALIEEKKAQKAQEVNSSQISELDLEQPENLEEPEASSVVQDDEDELLAAMEEEMIAQLQYEQEALEKDRDNASIKEKTMSDLANKFD
ncbi:hypothetical protein NBRC116188_05800 [Oceaniserpentilla sp. 4NH20-0058]|uniref:SMC-Scp complex subunit ScpB n=1 Tax=Oceaniserpentilla sp. 4NH20-0058 TaxID=3127660 RepID=UPI003107D821